MMWAAGFASWMSRWLNDVGGWLRQRDSRWLNDVSGWLRQRDEPLAE
jgi:hypothetical protein